MQQRHATEFGLRAPGTGVDGESGVSRPGRADRRRILEGSEEDRGGTGTLAPLGGASMLCLTPEGQ